MLTQDQIQNLSGGTVTDTTGDTIGKVGQVYLDDRTDEPEWVTVRTGLFGRAESFVPLQGASAEGDTLRVAYSQAQVKDAPRVDADGHLSPEEEQRLYVHYGLTDDDSAAGTSGRTGADAGTSGGGGAGTAADAAASGRDDADDEAMTWSEERARVGTERREVGRARLRKYVVTEEQTVTVPVTREEVRLEREPVTDADRDRVSEEAPAEGTRRTGSTEDADRGEPAGGPAR
jgi:stress response protein YsnF